MTISKLIHIQLFKTIVIFSYKPQVRGQKQTRGKKIIHHTLVFKATDNLRESKVRKRIDITSVNVKYEKNTRLNEAPDSQLNTI